MIHIQKQTRIAYLKELQARYKTAFKGEKSIVLDEFTKTTGYTRKHAIHLLCGSYQHKAGVVKRPRARTYTEIDAVILAKICELFDWIASKRFQPQIAVGITELQKAGELLFLSTEQREKLIGISASSIDRILVRYHQRPTNKGRSYTKPGTLLKSQIPIRTFAQWNENKVGFFEMDLVGHEGGNAQGAFAFTLNMTDVKTGWSEQMAVANKGQHAVFAAIKTIRARILFALLGLDSDSGSEFINDILYRYCIQEKITFTRGRPGKKNDNPFVEQKNDSIVRHWVGYKRYDRQEQVKLLNDLYELLRLYTNFFLPVMKLQEKTRIGSKIKKRYDTAKTPYQRILEAEDVSEGVKNKLTEQYKLL
ncbi:MAG: transposase, partial [Candidatus Levybacteria bacterium CG_4_10_14_0_8_um_filter_35_23]